jgi:hypothetical protein
MKHSVAQTVDQRAPKGIPSKEDYAVQQADGMRSRRAYHESPLVFASVCLFSILNSHPASLGHSTGKCASTQI